MGKTLPGGVAPISSISTYEISKLESSVAWQFYSSCRGRYKLAILGALVLAAALWEVVPGGHILAWLVAVLVSQISSQAMCSAFGRASAAGSSETYWKWLFAAGVAISALVAGIAGIYLFPVGSMPHQFVLALYLACIGCVAVITYSAFLPSSIIAILLVMLPLCGNFASQRSQFGYTMGAVLLLFTVALISAAAHMHRVLMETLKLRIEKDGLIESLSREKEKIEGLNAELEAEVLERRLIAESLSRSEDRYRAVVQGQTEFVCRWLADYGLSFANEAYRRYLHADPDDLLGRSFLEVVHPADLEQVLGFFESISQGTGPEICEYRVNMPGKEIRWLQWTCRPILDKLGQVKEYQGVGRDITARKKAEEALAASEEKYRSIVENAGEGIVVVQGTKAGFVNPKILAYTELSEDVLKAGEFIDFFHPDDRQLLKDACLKATQGEEPPSAELRFLNKTGDRSWFQLKAVGISWEGKQGILGFITDVTWRKEAERALQKSHEELEVRVRERTAELNEMNKKLQLEIADRLHAEESLRNSEQRFRTIFEKARDCIFVKDIQLRYTHLNPAMQAIIEADESDTTGLTDRDLYGDDQAVRLMDEDMRVLVGQVVEAEHTLMLKGRELTFNCVKVPMINSSGEIVGLCGIARDVTERSRTESQRQRSGLDFGSKFMTKTLNQVRLAAKSDSLVLLLGESGSGKDFLAGHIHHLSPRSGGPFFAINMAAVAQELAESELFGHEAGSFTGARTRKRGMLELAEGGTLLLNEIGELSLTLQAKLLTFLDTRSFTRVGGVANIEVDARLIAATNRDLGKEVEAGRFRHDLYHRLNVFAIRVPSLRDRLDDLPLLVETILSQLCAKLGRGRGSSHGCPVPANNDALSLAW